MLVSSRQGGRATAESISVKAGWCAIAGRVTYALWDGEVPIVPATVYLREYDDESPNALRRRAYALLPFFRWLATQDFAFWEVTEPRLKLFRQTLKRRVNLKEIPGLPTPPAAPKGRGVRIASQDSRPIERSTANAYLGVLCDLMKFWQFAMADNKEFVGMRTRGSDSLRHLSFRTQRRPAVFRISLRSHRRLKPRRGLPPDTLHAIWHALEANVPRPPAVLLLNARTQKQRARRRRAAIAFAKRRLRFYRDKAVWALLMASACRIGELVLLRSNDLDRSAGYVRLRYRAEDAYLGSLKTGPDDIFIGHDNRYLAHLDEWDTHGQIALQELRQLQGSASVATHSMLFCNVDGAPLTQNAVRRMFRRLDHACGITAAGIKFSPHIARHTIATLLKSAGVPIEVRRKFLRHARSSTTDDYGYMHDPVVREALTRFWTTGSGAL